MSDQLGDEERAMSGTNPASDAADVVSLGDEQRAVEILAQSVLGLWEVVNNLTRLRPTKREEFRVTIFGSAIPAATGIPIGQPGGHRHPALRRHRPGGHRAPAAAPRGMDCRAA
jgi:hypothetical protein